ncbi:MAG: FprA family A-type flavoprotein, partial [Ignisphaera sp.]
VYTSMYGFIKEMASTIAGEASKFFNTIKSYKFIDVHRDLVSDMLGDLLDAEAVILATATYDADVFPYAKYLIELLIAKTPKNKKILVVSNYGWGAVAGKKIASILQSAGFKVVDVIEFRSGRLLDNIERLREGVEKLARES